MCRMKSIGLFAALLIMSSPLAVDAQTGGVNWRTNLDAAKVEAGQTGRLMLLHFYTDSCGPCKVLDKKVFNQPHLGLALERNFVPVKVDSERSPALAGLFRIERVPTDVIVTAEGKTLAKFGCPNTPDEYLKQLENLANHHRQTTGAPQSVVAQPPVNSAYAALNVPRAPTQVAPGSAVPVQPPVATPAQSTTNPYVATPATAATTTPTVQSSRYGQLPAAPPAISNTKPIMPGNAMPQSYRNSYADAAAAPVAASTAQRGQAAAASATTSPAAPAISAAVAPAAAPVAAATRDDSITPTASEAVVATAKPASLQLPPGAPPVGFDGCCPVTLKFANKWVVGRVDIGMEHRGRLYLFAGEKEREQFAANPDAYSPVFSGLDPVLMLDQSEAIAGSRKFGFKYRGAFYLFSSEETKQKFSENPDSYAVGVRQAMNRIDGVGSPVMRR